MPLPVHYIEDEIGVSLVGHVGRYLNGSVAPGVLVDPSATDYRTRNGIAADEQRGGVDHTLDDKLTAGEVERGVACLLARFVVPGERGAAAASSSQQQASGAVEYVADEEELVARAGSGPGEVHLMLHRVMFEKHKRRIG